MISLMGPPPLDFLRQCGEKADQYWEKNGQRGYIIPLFLDESCTLLTLQSRRLEKFGPDSGYKLGSDGSETGTR